MALERLEVEIEGGADDLCAGDVYAASISGRSAESDAVSSRLNEQDGLAAMLAVQASRFEGVASPRCWRRRAISSRWRGGPGSA